MAINYNFFGKGKTFIGKKAFYLKLKNTEQTLIRENLKAVYKIYILYLTVFKIYLPDVTSKDMWFYAVPAVFLCYFLTRLCGRFEMYHSAAESAWAFCITLQLGQHEVQVYEPSLGFQRLIMKTSESDIWE